MINLDSIRDKATIYDTSVDIPEGQDTIEPENRLYVMVANVSPEKFEDIKSKFRGRVGYTLIYVKDIEDFSIEEVQMLRDGLHGAIYEKGAITDETRINILSSNERIISVGVSDEEKFDEQSFIYNLLSMQKKKLIGDCQQKVFKLITEDLFSPEALDTLEKNILLLFANKDEVTRSHVMNVFKFSRIMVAGLKAMNMELGDDEQLLLQQAALLHDLAKLAVPDQLLKNNDPFSDGEFEAMKEHADINAAFLFSGVIGNVVSLASQHHFTYDNDRGYGPKPTLRGDDISPIGRMLSVVDSFEAMTARRPYQNPKTLDSAFEILYTNSRPFGTSRTAGQFDPLYAKAFVIGFRELFATDKEFRESVMQRETSRGFGGPNMEEEIMETLDRAVKRFEPEEDQRGGGGNDRKVG